jgi:hypothetical protein
VLAMQEEPNNFKRNKVWSQVPRPKQNIVGTKWVFRNKQDEQGVVTRNKARLVAKGYAQVSVFRNPGGGVPGPTSESLPRAPAQMGRREAEREGGGKGSSRREAGVREWIPWPSC